MGVSKAPIWQRGLVRSVWLIYSALLIMPELADARLGMGDTSSSQMLQQWEYRVGDSPADAAGKLQLLAGGGDAAWVSFHLAEGVPEVGGGEFVWYRTRLPQQQWDEPVLSIGGLLLAFEVYLDGVMLHQSRPLESDYGNKFAAVQWHRIDLPQPS